ncbi:5' nucleotidase, deoxy (Pyrimidine), cytosolic type C protein (NT5C) [compost metagenome]
MLIAFDIDDTLGCCFSASLAYFNKCFNKNYFPEEVAEWVNSHFDCEHDFFSQLYNIRCEDVTKIFVERSHEILTEMPVFPLALIEVKRLVSEGHKPVYITARDSRWKGITSNWLMSANFPHGALYFTREKANLALELGVDLFYEDSVHNIRSLRKVGVNCILVDAFPNWGWNNEKYSVPRVHWNPLLSNFLSVKS